MRDVFEPKVRYLSTVEVSRMLGVAPGTLASWRSLKSNGPAFFKFGRRVLYRLDDLDAWIAAQRARNTAEAEQVRKRWESPAKGGL